METSFHPTHGMDLNENGEWIKIPLENVIPKWLYESLSDEDEDVEIACVLPYLADKFKEWLMDKRDIKERRAEDYLRAYESGYGSLYDDIGIDLYRLLENVFEGSPDGTVSALTMEDAPDLVKIYLDTMLEKIDENEDSYTKTELCALASYHAFIIDMVGSGEKKYIKEKSIALPEEDKFLSWLENEYKMDYGKAVKIVNSVKRMNTILPSMASEPMTFIDVLRALPPGDKRENYIKLVRTKRKEIKRNADCSYKTIQNGFANVAYYVLFLRSSE